MRTYKRTISVLCVTLIGWACGGAQESSEHGSKAASEAAAPVPTKAAAPAAEVDKAPAVAEGEGEGEEDIEPAPPLTEEEKALIAADPKDLSPDDRRKRAYALRKKIMQNPNSPTARQLRRTAEAIKRGDIEFPDQFKKDGRGGQPAPSEAPQL